MKFSNSLLILTSLCLMACKASAEIAFVATIPNVGGALVVNADRDRIYDSGNPVSVIDGQTNAVIDEIPNDGISLGDINETTGKIYGFNPSAYVNGRFPVVVVDPATKIVRNVNGAEANFASDIAVNAATNRIYETYSRSTGTLAVIDGATDRQITQFVVGTIVEKLAVNPATNTIYVTGIEPGTPNRSVLHIINGATNTVTATITIGTGATTGDLDVAVNSDTNTVYVLSIANGRSVLNIINGATNAVTAQVPVSSTAQKVVVNETANHVYVLSKSDVTAFDETTLQLIGQFSFASAVSDLAINERSSRLYVSTTTGIVVLRDFPTDTTPPTVTFTSPTNGARLTSLPQVSGTALDNRGGSGLSRVALFLKRSSDGKYWTGKNWSRTQTELRTTLGTFDTQGQSFTNADALPSGENLKQDTYFLTAVAIDRANAFGNRTATTVSFRVIDVIDPQIAITYPSDGAMLNQLTKISGSLTDNAGGSGPSRVLLQIRRSSDRKYFDGTMWTSSAVTLSTELIGSGEAVAWQRIGGLPPVVSGRDVYTISAIGYDRAFNRDDATVTITVGTAATAT